MPATSTSSRLTPAGRRIVKRTPPALLALETPLSSTPAESEVAWLDRDGRELPPFGTEAAVTSARSVTTVSRPARLRVMPSVIFEGADVVTEALGASRSFEVNGDRG
jgi:hypothetical protein